MRMLGCSVLMGLLVGLVASCAAGPPAADEVLAKARAAATAGQKNIFLLFDASW